VSGSSIGMVWGGGCVRRGEGIFQGGGPYYGAAEAKDCGGDFYTQFGRE